MTLQNQINKTAQRIEMLSNKMKAMENAKVPTDEYREVQKQIDAATAKLSALNGRMEKWVELGKSTDSSTFKAMQYDAAELENTIEYAKGELLDLEQTGKAFQNQTETDAYKKTAHDLENANAQMAILKERMRTTVESEKGMTKEAGKHNTKLKQSTKSASKLGAAIQGALCKMKKLNTSTSKAQSGFSNLVRTMKMMMLSMVVFQVMQKGLEFVSSGLKNLAVYSSEYNKTMSEFVSSTSQLKDALAVAFQPILNVVIPILSKFIGYISSACNAVSRFFAILSGKSTYTKAIKQNKDYASSLDKVGDSAKKAQSSLAGFDDLDVLSKSDTSSSGGSSNGAADGSGFKEESVGEISDWAQAFKDAIEAGDWYGVGSLLADKLNSVMDSIDWKSIQQKAKQFGVNLALGLNGFNDEVDWYGIGSTIGNALQTAISFAFGFVTTFDWSSLGTGLGNVINGAINSVDWGMLAQTLSGAVTGLLDATAAFLSTVDWNQIGQDVGTFLMNVDWLGILMGVGNVIWAAIGGVWQFLCGLLDGLLGDFLPVDSMTQSVTNAFSTIGQITSGLVNDLVHLIIDPFVNNQAAFQEAIEGFLEVVQFVMNTISEVISDILAGLSDIYESHLKPFIKNVTDGVSEIVGAFLVFWNTYMKPILDKWAAKFQETYESHLKPVIEKIVTIIGQVIDIINTLWTKWLQPFIAWLVKYILPVISPIINTLFTILNTLFCHVVDGIGNVLSVISVLLSGVGAAVSAIGSMFTSMRDTVTAIFEALWTHGIKPVINSILSGVESMANGVINGLNGMIRALNKLKFDIPDWVPKFGGNTFGLNLSEITTVSLPRLANGGITTGSTIANIGEAGREAVLPLENNTEWMNDLADKINANRNITIRYTGSLAELGRVLKPVIEMEDSRIGASLVLD